MYAQGGYGQAPPQQQQYNAGYQQQQQYAPQQQQQQQPQYGQQQMTEQPQQAQQTQQQQEVVTQAAPTDQGKPQPIYVDTQHDDMVHDAQLDYYGTKLATSSSDRTVKIYDVSGNSYAPNATLTGHSGPIYQLSWSHPKYGTLLASASFDGSVLIHREARQGEWILVKAFVGLHESSVNSVQFAPHEYGLVCAAGSSDGRVSVLTHGGESNGDDEWTVEYLNDTPLGVNAVSWAPYGVGKETTGGGGEGEEEEDDEQCQPLPPRLVTGGSDNGIRMWTKNPSTGIWEQSVVESGDAQHKDWVRDVACAPSIVPGMSVIASCSEDKTVIIWKQGGDDDATAAAADDEKKWSPKVLNTFDDPVWRVSWSITGNILAVSSGDANVTLWKEELDGVWSLVNQVEDTTGGAQGE
eukprot:CAMPEP_0201715760 /NCGR_PEP_ID=MMETSP0593-20130828/1875_1 /ASSEMBLY_ACC=CAM_ASM_000672 /TAXON_ID=267983 /ORGANISM="Skeletonema japonicum, Strain CCMP2506" /LENGTH=408 /DNA_ID=CAMNT_0048205353 /DNA_START=27 /DNA_END=1253 /DNA_ORIENTATION=+